MNRPTRRLAVRTTVILAAILAVGASPAGASVAAQRPAADQHLVRVVYGAGAPTAGGAGGVYAYDAALVPEGAEVALVSLSRPERTWTLLAVRDLAPDQAYAVHLHVDPCGADPAGAGGRYQQVPDPQQPSTDPAYANPVNEVWLDVTTNDVGAGIAMARNPWRYRAAPGSVVLHAAGARVACLTLAAS